jgi:pilus assembly protein TadC
MLIIWAAVYFFLDYRVYQRTKELEEVLPDFLQLASSNIAAGMPIDRALWYAIRPNFGVLAKEMEDVAKATMAGEDLEASLLRLTERYESVMLKRSVSILIEGLHAGGEMADLLNKIALNIDEMKIMKKEMAANVTTYAIFITFASVIIAPFLFALSTELLTIIIKITSTLHLESSSMLTLGTPDPHAVANFKIFAVFMLLISTMFSASLVSIIKRGNVIDGIKTIPVYAVIAIAIYYFSLWVLGGMFSGLI